MLSSLKIQNTIQTRSKNSTSSSTVYNSNISYPEMSITQSSTIEQTTLTRNLTNLSNSNSSTSNIEVTLVENNPSEKVSQTNPNWNISDFASSSVSSSINKRGVLSNSRSFYDQKLKDMLEKSNRNVFEAKKSKLKAKNTNIAQLIIFLSKIQLLIQIYQFPVYVSLALRY